jgi:TRAP-type C4-dicarboxylate transport system permease small subunit
MEYFERFAGLISKYADYIARIGVVAMMVIVVANVILRLVWKSITGTYDYVSIICALLVGLAISFCAYIRGHIEVEILMERLPKRVQIVVSSIVTLASTGFFAIVAWQLIVLGNEMNLKGETTMTAYLPLHPYMYVIAAGCILMAIIILAQFLKKFQRKVKP